MKNILMIVMLSLAGCTAPSPPANNSAGLPNPASVYCTEHGGTLEIRQGPDGETGYCHLPDGRVVEEWKLYRSQSKDAGE